MREIGLALFFVMFIVVWREEMRDSGSTWRDVVSKIFAVIVTLAVVGVVGLIIAAA